MKIHMEPKICLSKMHSKTNIIKYLQKNDHRGRFVAESLILSKWNKDTLCGTY